MMTSEVIPLARLIALTLVPYFLASPYSVSPETILCDLLEVTVLVFLDERFLVEPLLVEDLVPRRLFPSAAHDETYLPLLSNGYSYLGKLCAGVELVPFGS